MFTVHIHDFSSKLNLVRAYPRRPSSPCLASLNSFACPLVSATPLRPGTARTPLQLHTPASTASITHTCSPAQTASPIGLKAYPHCRCHSRDCHTSLHLWLDCLLWYTFNHLHGQRMCHAVWVWSLDTPLCSSLVYTKHIRTTAYHPIGNGWGERLHHQLKASLKVQPDPTNWTDPLCMSVLPSRTSWETVTNHKSICLYQVIERSHLMKQRPKGIPWGWQCLLLPWSL